MMGGSAFMKIEDGVLIDCGNTAADVAVPEGVREIGENAFYKCSAVEHIKLPESVEVIGNCAFKYCEHLENIRMPEHITDLGAEVFQYCWNLRDIDIPEGVTSIGETMFEGCGSLERIRIPDSMQRVTRAAFATCKRLRRIEIDMNKLKILPYGARNYAVLGCITAHTYDRKENAGEQQKLVNEYILKHNVSFFDIALSSDSKAAVNYIISNDLLKPELIDRFIAESTSQRRGEITAMLLNYKNKLGLTGKESEEEWDPFA